MTKKHMTLEDRYTIAHLLNEGSSFKKIANAINKNCTSVSREIKNHLVFQKTGAYSHAFNECVHRKGCPQTSLCNHCIYNTKKRCAFCSKCNTVCSDFKAEKCAKLEKPPYVCNACPDLRICTLEKRYYKPIDADKEYRAVLSESRSGISYTEAEIKHIDSVISPLIRKGQSINHICANNKDSLMVSESTIYRLIDYNLFSARNIDLPRKVKYCKRKKPKDFKVDKLCRQNRTYNDFLKYQEEHSTLPITQMDTVEGTKGGKVLLTIHFVKAELMIAFLRDSNDSQSVIDIFERLYIELRSDIFMELMPIILTDNGSEFSNPKTIEFDRQGNQRTHVFYCDASAPGQKGSIEKNHELIRYVLPKGTPFDSLTQEDITLLMDHINSYCRESLGNKCPYDVFKFFYGTSILEALNCHRIPGNEVNLTTSLLKGKI